MISTIDEAIKILNNWGKGIPFEAIRYLRNQPPSEKILSEIIFAFDHACDKHYYSPITDYYKPTPLWYAIVAEKHLSEKLIPPVINLFTTTTSDWDFLNEQGEYLIGQLAEKYPDIVMEKTINVIDKMVAMKSSYPYLYLFDAFYFADINKYKSWFLKTLENKNLTYPEAFAVVIADLEIKEAIPIIKKRIAETKDAFDRIELKECLKQLETGISEYPELAMPYFRARNDWERHYLVLEKYFLKHLLDKDFDTIEP